jgi:pyruvate/2-oxoglutarate dehydrogenase complex dihydrolipoamide dehydrogenase (E3) component
MASAGKKAAVIERRYVGGSCPNIACLPSKNIIYSAKVAHLAKHAADFGLPTSHDGVNMMAVRERKRAMVSGLIAMHEDRYDKTHTELILGEGRFVAPKTIEVNLANGGTRLLTGTQVVICTGSRATILRIPGLRESKPLTHIEALELDGYDTFPTSISRKVWRVLRQRPCLHRWRTWRRSNCIADVSSHRGNAARRALSATGIALRRRSPPARRAFF